MSIEAKYYQVLANQMVKCELCPHNCIIPNHKTGICGVRENVDGKLYSLIYSRPCAVHVDPIEKKPLHHFLPGSRAFSIGTAGCNMSCMHCQNWSISKAKPNEVKCYNINTEELINTAITENCESIAYTYNEPSMNFEHVLEIAKAAHKKKIRNIMVTNGYINEKPLDELYSYIDAANVDLKGFDEKFYKKICGAKLEPVLKAITLMHKKNVWIELTNLIIPGHNDDSKEIENMCKWIIDNIGKNYPLHFSAFHPTYKLNNVEPTPHSTLKKAQEIALKVGLNYVYLGNVSDDIVTQCPNCQKKLIHRSIYSVSIEEKDFKKGQCSCGEKIAGIWL